MLTLLKALREKVVIGYVGGSDLPKIEEQLGIHGQDGKYSLASRSSLVFRPCSLNYFTLYCISQEGFRLLFR